MPRDSLNISITARDRASVILDTIAEVLRRRVVPVNALQASYMAPGFTYQVSIVSIGVSATFTAMFVAWEPSETHEVARPWAVFDNGVSLSGNNWSAWEV